MIAILYLAACTHWPTVEQLGSPLWTVRAESSARLKAAGWAAFPACLLASRVDDPEIRARATGAMPPSVKRAKYVLAPEMVTAVSILTRDGDPFVMDGEAEWLFSVGLRDFLLAARLMGFIDDDEMSQFKNLIANGVYDRVDSVQGLAGVIRHRAIGKPLRYPYDPRGPKRSKSE